MTSQGGLSAAFRAHLASDALERVAEGDARLDEVLGEIVSSARDALPSISVPSEAFVRRLAVHFPPNAVGIESLADLHCGDLFVACGCELGDRAALRRLEETCLRDLPSHAGLDPGELRQVVRAKLLVKTGDRPPKIATYSGRGALKGWVRAVAARAAINLTRRQRGEVPLEDRDERLMGSLDAETTNLKRLCAREFRSVFTDAFATLSPRDRTILRRHYVDGVTMDRIAAAYRVHRITVVRWVDKARDELASEIRRRLSKRAGSRKGELESLVRFVRSQLDLSLKTHLSRG